MLEIPRNHAKQNKLENIISTNWKENNDYNANYEI